MLINKYFKIVQEIKEEEKGLNRQEVICDLSFVAKMILNKMATQSV